MLENLQVLPFLSYDKLSEPLEPGRIQPANFGHDFQILSTRKKRLSYLQNALAHCGTLSPKDKNV